MAHKIQATNIIQARKLKVNEQIRKVTLTFFMEPAADSILEQGRPDRFSPYTSLRVLRKNLSGL